MPPRLTVTELADRPELLAVLVQHAYRGIRVQFLLRLLLLAFMFASLATAPPAHDRIASYLIAGSYAVWAAGVALWTRQGGIGPVQWMWVALVVDALALTALTLVAGASAEQTWTAHLLVNGFFLVPVLAATQLRPEVSAAVCAPAVVAYFASSAATKAANTEPWGPIIVRTLLLVGLSVGCVALSRVQLSRVMTIAGLAQDRTDLLKELLNLEARERAGLAEQLHDGALQFVLAARHDLEDAQLDGDPEAFARVDHALTESSTLLRATVSQLHPAVLDQAGLGRALQDLATSTAARADLRMTVDVAGWPDQPQPWDGLLYGCARELLTNVVKHARASHARIVLTQTADLARIEIADDGRGMGEDEAAARLAAGHIGLASLRTRVAAAGGTLTVSAGRHPSPGWVGAGTVVSIELPIRHS
jgi:two-component system NarL family sensor kinase